MKPTCFFVLEMVCLVACGPAEEWQLDSLQQEQIISPSSIVDVQNQALDRILRPAATLAHFLGYGWCGGTRSAYVGEDFYRTTNGWKVRYNSNDPYAEGLGESIDSI